MKDLDMVEETGKIDTMSLSQLFEMFGKYFKVTFNMFIINQCSTFLLEYACR
jgi:hypothetical protein